MWAPRAPRGPARSGRADIGAYEFIASNTAPTLSPVADQSTSEDMPLSVHFDIDDAETADSLQRINAEIMQLAPALNSQSYAVKPQSSNGAVPLRAVAKNLAANRYIFAVSMADAATTAAFSVPALADASSIEVIGEGRNLTSSNGTFEDAFEGYAVHLYRIPPR